MDSKGITKRLCAHISIIDICIVLCILFVVPTPTRAASGGNFVGAVTLEPSELLYVDLSGGAVSMTAFNHLYAPLRVDKIDNQIAVAEMGGIANLNPNTAAPVLNSSHSTYSTFNADSIAPGPNDVTPLPEPATYFSALLALMALAYHQRRRFFNRGSRGQNGLVRKRSGEDFAGGF